MRHFVLVYDRAKGVLVVQQEFPEDGRRRALERRFELEALYQAEHDFEVVVLSASSLAGLQRTHGRYFRNIHDLIAG